MKLIGILMIIISCSFIGINEADKLKIKCDILNQIISMIKQIKIQLNYCVPTTREIVSDLKDKDFSYLYFVKKCFENYDNLPFDILWKDEVEKCSLPINKEDILMLISFGKSLGTTDVDGQIELCNSFIQKFQISLDKYTLEKEKKSKLYISLGVLLGVGVSIILI